MDLQAKRRIVLEDSEIHFVAPEPQLEPEPSRAIVTAPKCPICGSDATDPGYIAQNGGSLCNACARREFLGTSGASPMAANVTRFTANNTSAWIAGGFRSANAALRIAVGSPVEAPTPAPLVSFDDEDFQRLYRLGMREAHLVCLRCRGENRYETLFDARTVRCKLCQRTVSFEQFFQEHP
jgi:hypothetical protein